MNTHAQAPMVRRTPSGAGWIRRFIFWGSIIVLILGVFSIAADKLVHFIPADKERQLFPGPSRMLNKQIKAADERAKVETYLQKLVSELARGWDGTRHTFNVRVSDSASPNVHLYPGGYILVTRGLLTLVKTENGLAMVLAHEMGHQYRRHSLRNMGRGTVVVLAILSLSGLDQIPHLSDFLGYSMQWRQAGFTRNQEQEADRVAYQLMKRKYGHTHGAEEFFVAVNEQGGKHGGLPHFFVLHPATKQRVNQLLALGGKQTQTQTIKKLSPWVEKYLAASAPETE